MLRAAICLAAAALVLCGLGASAGETPPPAPPPTATPAAPAAPSPAPARPALTLNAESFTFNSDANTFLCERGVKAVHGDTTLTADRLDGAVDETSRAVKSFVATGNVVIVNPQMRAYSLKAVFDLKTGVILLTGSPEKRPRVFQLGKNGVGAAVTEADQIAYNDKDKSVSWQGNPLFIMPDAKLLSEEKPTPGPSPAPPATPPPAH